MPPPPTSLTPHHPHPPASPILHRRHHPRPAKPAQTTTPVSAALRQPNTPLSLAPCSAPSPPKVLDPPSCIDYAFAQAPSRARQHVGASNGRGGMSVAPQRTSTPWARAPKRAIARGGRDVIPATRCGRVCGVVVAWRGRSCVHAMRCAMGCERVFFSFFLSTFHHLRCEDERDISTAITSQGGAVVCRDARVHRSSCPSLFLLLCFLGKA
jgi:hypothetical protein